MIETVNVIEHRVIENQKTRADDRWMRVSEFKSNYCFRIQILNVIEHRVTERTSDQDSEYPLLKTNSRVHAPPCTGELNGSMRRDKASERERETEGRTITEMMRGATYNAIKRVGGRSSTGLQPLAWDSPSPLGDAEGPTSWREG